MNYISVCSGIEAATVAWHPLGWRPLWFSEIEKFPSALLAHHYPDVPNLGDMEKFHDWPDARPDILVGGTPCQSFSVAGLRKGLDDPRGNLALVYLAIAERYRPQWMVWENVPGFLSSDGGRAMGSFLGALAKLGYGYAYRVLDAQYVRVDGFGRAVPQRRRRVFIVGYFGDWRRAAAVLFDTESLSGNPPPRRETGKGTTHDVAPCIGASGRGFERAGDTRGQDAVIPIQEAAGTLKGGSGERGYPDPSDGNGGGLIPQVAAPLLSGAKNGGPGHGALSGANRESNLIPQVAPTIRAGGNKTGGDRPPGTDVDTADSLIPSVANPLTHRTGKGINTTCDEGQTPIPTYGISGNWIGRKPENGGNAVEPMHDVSPNLTSADRHGVASMMQVRRLTPRECERLQGFPDDYTLIPFTRGKPAVDGTRYKALGNSMAVNVMRWIGMRIQMVNENYGRSHERPTINI